MIQNLSKENFWDELHAKYPDGVDLFCKWIDEYKKEVNWNLLFNSDSEYQNTKGKNALAPKFHDLPYEMQIGIIDRFQTEIFNNAQGNGKLVFKATIKPHRKSITILFMELDGMIKDKARGFPKMHPEKDHGDITEIVMTHPDMEPVVLKGSKVHAMDINEEFLSVQKNRIEFTLQLVNGKTFTCYKDMTDEEWKELKSTTK